eukprot:4479816-Ditylum_brightwellii.AAC.1
MEEWHQNLDEELQLKFKEQNIIISEALEEQNANMEANFQVMLEVYKEECKTSQQQIEQLTTVVQQLDTTLEQGSAFCRTIQSGVETMRVNATKNRREKDETEVET